MKRFPRVSTVTCLAALALQACSGSSSTTGPKKSNVPAAQLAEGDLYRKVYPTFVTQSVIAASNIQPNGNGKLEYLVKGAEPIVLSQRAEPAHVLVSSAEPIANVSALFVDEPSAEGVGALTFVDLAAKPVKTSQIKDARNVPAEGVFYGADGHQILYVSGFDGVTGLGKLQWSDGTNVKDVATGVSPAGVAFSASRASAVAVIGIDPATLANCTRDCGRGSLIAIDMRTGTKTQLATDVLLFGVNNDLAFSISADGGTVVYTTFDHKIARVPFVGGDPMTISAKGVSPTVTKDGQTVVFYADDKLFSWANDAPTQLVDACTPQTALTGGCSYDSVRPTLSPDQKWVVFFKSVTRAGEGAGVGDAWTVGIGGGEALKVASNVGVDTIEFNSASTRISAVGDLLSLDGRPSYEAIGNLFVGAPGGATQKFSVGTRPGNVGGMSVTDSLVWIGDMAPGSPVGAIFVASGSDAAPVKLKSDVVPNTLRVSKTFDTMLFMADPADELFESVYRIGAMWGSTSKGPARVLTNAEEGVIQGVFSLDGRANVVIVRGEKAGVWTLPTP